MSREFVVCPGCDDELEGQELCQQCGCCDLCCECDELYDADELGLDPEDDDKRRYHFSEGD